MTHCAEFWVCDSRPVVTIMIMCSAANILYAPLQQSAPLTHLSQ